MRIRAKPIRVLHGRTPPLLRWSQSDSMRRPWLSPIVRLSRPARAFTAILPQPARYGISFWRSSLQDMAAAGTEPATHPHVFAPARVTQQMALPSPCNVCAMKGHPLRPTIATVADRQRGRAYKACRLRPFPMRPRDSRRSGVLEDPATGEAGGPSRKSRKSR